ncbi:uncharacterized protein LOC107640128 [Arachis ipaensis]|uniref:uncharacterized protein LOC107640128 n=1 Tax=Arachis ipaensis TaxID=130454 RepID=UPI0007AF9226|nr:uncharacterized protein LOC107640128 [Arachis ipaensis]
MVAESSKSSRSRSSVQKRELLCGHGERPLLQTSGTKNNTGRRFWGCVYYEIKEEFEFFRWADLEGESEDPQVVRLKRKILALKAKVRDIEWKLKVAAVLGKVGWISLFVSGCRFG